MAQVMVATATARAILEPILGGEALALAEARQYDYCGSGTAYACRIVDADTDFVCELRCALGMLLRGVHPDDPWVDPFPFASNIGFSRLLGRIGDRYQGDRAYKVLRDIMVHNDQGHFAAPGSLTAWLDRVWREEGDDGDH